MRKLPMAILPEFHNPVILPKTPYLDTYAFQNSKKKKKKTLILYLKFNITKL